MKGTHLKSWPRILLHQAGHKDSQGAAIVVAIVAAVFIIIAGYIVAGRSFLFFTGALRSSDFKNAREAAEYGAAELTNQLNKDGISYLLITQPPCWQSTDLNMSGIFMPPGNKLPKGNLIPGVPTNTSLQWKVVGTNSAAEASAAISSGNYSRYQLVEYRPPRRPGQSSDLSFSDNCPSTASAKFANRFGGSAYLTIKAEVYRKGSLVSSHGLTQEVHVKGLMASSSGETSIVLAGEAFFNTTTPWLDLDGDEEKDSNEPWLDIFCIYCTGTTQAELRTEDPPIGVGFQGNMANTYQGTIITGTFNFPPFRFEDLDGNGIINGAERPVPADLYSAVSSRLANSADWQAEAIGVFSGEGDNLSNKIATDVAIRDSNGVDTGAKAKVEFCAKNGKSPPCNDSISGDIQQITKVSGNPGLTAGYFRKSDICASIKNLGLPTYCTSDLIEIRITTTAIIYPSLISGSQWYPFGTDADGNRLTTYVPECAEAIDSINNKTYIGCIVERIDLDGGNEEIIVVTNQTNSKPVYIFVQHTSLSKSDPAIDFNGTQALMNERGNDPNSLAIFGLPPTTTNPADETCNQVVSLSGTDNMQGIWAWLPRGSVQSGVGTASLSGILWGCDFDGRGAFKFLGSNYDPMQGDCGANTPCGIYKYRAQGIAQVDRV